MGTAMYNITSPGSADGSLSTQLDTAHLLKANTFDSQSNEEPLHLLSMLMPMPLFSAFVHLSKNEAIDAPPPSLQLSNFFDDLIKEAHPSPSDVANDSLSLQDPTSHMASDYRDGNTSKGSLNDSNGSIKAGPRPGEEGHIQAHRSEEATPPVSDHWEGDAWRETLDKQEYIILPLFQVTIQALVSKRNGHEAYKIVGRMDLQQARGYSTKEKQ
ncbi:hypothetical protein AJ78_08890 [Emergomyces pasteurianus Ep9510]|uniref:Uncharacterized protein n=1 Tax=Emergomyces pasteurianus Ep9510 TaxID=1447872 RepID=A0A1J9Q3X2_9EURO|nr:hypothetical protein AJ78_08890 [Emergomyces pasteurianus Ep9510]